MFFIKKGLVTATDPEEAIPASKCTFAKNQDTKYGPYLRCVRPTLSPANHLSDNQYFILTSESRSTCLIVSMSSVLFKFIHLKSYQ